MTVTVQGLSDKALAVFAFAAYHQLESGQRVSSVVQRDGAGHKADDDALKELTARGLVRADGELVHFTEEGLKALATVIEGMHRTLSEG